jgi:capsular exopolysaccharide synthesis family protein
MNTKIDGSKDNAQKDMMELVKKYFYLFWKKKYLLLIITICFSLVWLVFYRYFLKETPRYSASTIIKFDDPRFSREISGITDFSQMDISGKIALLTTRNFLNSVVDSLKLNFRLDTKDINRFELIKSIRLNEKTKYGNYKLVINPTQNVSVYLTKPDERIENKLILTKEMTNEPALELNIDGSLLVLNSRILNRYKEIQFSYSPKRFFSEHIKNTLQMGMDRSRTVLTITYIDQEPNIAAKVINTLATMYLDQLLYYKKFRTTSMMKSLEEQLEASKKELGLSEESLRQFRERNPYLTLSSEGSGVVNEIATQQTELTGIDETLERLDQLEKQKNTADKDSKYRIYLEILALLNGQGVSGAQVLSEQFDEHLRSRNQLLSNNYSPQHPDVFNAETKLEDLVVEVNTRLAQFLNQQENRKKNIRNSIMSSEQNIRRLPRNELRLAELQRDREVKANIYSNILIRFNEAKVADASIIPDAYIIDQADVPMKQSDVMKRLQKVALGPILGLVLSISLIVLLDFLDNTIKSSKDVESRLRLPVLATIPVILDDKEFPEIVNPDKQLDPKLITSDYAPDVASEKFRVIRTKLVIKQKDQRKDLIIASLTPGDGKSLVSANLAITFAQQKIPTLLIDCDLRRGVLHNSFNCYRKPGLTNLLVGINPIDETEIARIIQKTHVPNLSLMTNGINVPNPSELLGSARMLQLYKELQKYYSMIIFDTPPIEIIPDMLVLNSFIHNILLVARYGKTNLNRLSEKIAEFSNIRNDFCGVVVNASADAVEKGYYAYSYYHY